VNSRQGRVPPLRGNSPSSPPLAGIESRNPQLFLTLLIRNGCRNPPPCLEPASHTPAGIMRTRRGAAAEGTRYSVFPLGSGRSLPGCSTATGRKSGGPAPRSGFSTRKLLGGNETNLGKPLLRSVAPAQSPAPFSITGIVQGPSTAGIPEAAVVLRNTGGTVERAATADGMGSFRFENVTAGTCEVEIRRNSFAPSLTPAPCVGPRKECVPPLGVAQRMPLASQPFRTHESTQHQP
jgi:hypothetical protein